MAHRNGTFVALALGFFTIGSVGCNKDKEECHKLGLELRSAYIVYTELEQAGRAKNKQSFDSLKGELEGLRAKVEAAEITDVSGYLGKSNHAAKDGFLKRLPLAISYQEKMMNGEKPTSDEDRAAEDLGVAEKYVDRCK